MMIVQVLIEQLLRNQPMPPPAHFDHLHRQGSGLADQLLLGRQAQDPRLVDASGPHVSGREFEQLMRQNHASPSPFDQLLRQRHQDEQQQQVLGFPLCVSLGFSPTVFFIDPRCLSRSPHVESGTSASLTERWREADACKLCLRCDHV